MIDRVLQETCNTLALRVLAVLLLLGANAGNANGQDRAGPAGESFEIGVSSSEIGITSNFNGQILTVFGAIGHADMRVWHEQRYDIVVALFGPLKPLVVREKQRFFGIWINRDSELLPSAPVTYSIASTRELRDIAPNDALRRLSLGIDVIRLDGRKPTLGEEPPVFLRQKKFESALRDIKVSRGLYAENIGGVSYTPGESTLFRADLPLPADISTGEHVVRAYLFKRGTVIAQERQDIDVQKVGFEAEIDRFATNHSFLYGLFAVALAMATGWIGRVMFKRD